MTKGWSAIVVDIGVAYKEDTDHVNEIMKQVGDELMKDAAWQSILMGVDLWGVDSFGDSSVILKGNSAAGSKKLSTPSTSKSHFHKSA